MLARLRPLFSPAFAAVLLLAVAGRPVAAQEQAPAPIVLPTLGAPPAAPATVQTVESAPTSGDSRGAVLILRSGRVLQGFPQLVEGNYQVTLLQGGTVHVPREEVALICGSLAQAYEMQAARLNAGDTRARLALAAWCLRQELFDQASQELQRVESLNPQEPQLAVLKQQVELARQAALSARLASALPAETIAPASYEKPVAAESASSAADRARIDQLAPGSLETFSREVQPILLNGCAATACHGAHSESAFRLNGFNDGLQFTQARTRENLAAVLAQIDREDLAASPLLASPGTPGVCVSTGVWRGARDPRPQQIHDWLLECYPPPEPVEEPPALPQDGADGSGTMPATIPRLLPASTPAEAVPLEAAGADPATPEQGRTDVTPAHMPTPAETFAAQAAFDRLLEPGEGAAMEDAQQGGLQQGASPPVSPAAGASDPFDAEIFHRRIQQAGGR